MGSRCFYYDQWELLRSGPRGLNPVVERTNAAMPKPTLHRPDAFRRWDLGHHVVSTVLVFFSVACARGSDGNVAVTVGGTTTAAPHAAPSAIPLASGAPAPSTWVPFAVRERCPERIDDSVFFPAGSFGQGQAGFDEDAFRRHWYSIHLRAMAEPSLSCGDVELETYRFLWLRTFHAPIAVRLSLTGKGARVASVELSGAGGYSPGTVVHRAERGLSSDEWSQVQRALQHANFWSTTPWLPSTGYDGAQWILEGRVGSKYHVVDRWSPEAGSFRALALAFLKLARVTVPKNEIY